MSNPYIGEIRLFGGNFAPVGWAFCDGQLMAVAEHDALFSLIGTTYGGDGQETFALPDLRGRVPVQRGDEFVAGEKYGVEQVTVGIPQMPSHTHRLMGSSTLSREESPKGNVTGQTEARLYGNATPLGNMNVQSNLPFGGSQPHGNVQPFLCVNFIISLFGIYPSPT